MAGLEQSQGLHLQQTLSPQMQQSLHILQVPLFELRQLAAKELMENPVLEEEPGTAPSLESDAPEQSDFQEYTEPYYAQQRLGSSEDASRRHQLLLDSLTREAGLQETVLEQIEFLGLAGRRRQIAESIAGNLDPSGYLGAKIEEIAFPLGATPLEVEEVLEQAQNMLEPPGLAARDLGECLFLQLARKGRGDGLEALIVKKFLPELARRRFSEIAKRTGSSLDQVERAAERISQLEPRPGRQFESLPPQFVVPEVFVEKTEDGFSVRLNNEEIPRLKISSTYKDLLGEPGAEMREARSFIREKIRDGRFFLRSIEQRNETLTAIAREIVTRQMAFMESGPEYLKPMTMGQVAETVGVHETTVSRAVSGKFMSTPQGLFEMKFFFTSGYITEEGEAVSNESVRRAIKDLIDGEDLRKPLSDAKLCNMLASQGLKVARRTIAKYRDQLGILPSHLRKR